MPPRLSFMRKLRSFAIVTCGGYAAFCGICIYLGDSKFYKNVVLPIVHRLEPETAHSLALTLLKKQLISKPKYEDPPALRSRLWNLDFDNPIGLAAGFDKDGEAILGLHKIGFGFVEIGSVTPKPQFGNPKPRLFRLLQDNAIINRFGFNSDGHEIVHERLESITKDDLGKRGIIGVNLGKNADSTNAVEDYVKGVMTFGPIADYLVINISSPNTKGLRLLQRRQQLASIVDHVIEARKKLYRKQKPPILIKISPDLSEDERRDIAGILIRPGKPRIDGIIISNSTTSRPKSLRSVDQDEIGGLTGKPLKDLSTDAIRSMYNLTRGEIPIIGVGGVSSGADAYEKIRAGASLVQVYTALVYEGFPVITQIKKELTDLLKKDGFRSVSEAVGAEHHPKITNPVPNKIL